MVQGIASLGNNPAVEQPPMPEEAVSALGQGFSRLSPEEIQQLRDLQSELSDLSASKLKVLEQIITFLKDNADRYDEAVRILVKEGIVSPGDLPPDYVPSFFSILENMISQTAAKEQPQEFRHGGIASLRKKAEDVRRAGTGGDKILAHINSREAAMLRDTRGGGMNDSTGLPEYGFFDDIGKFFKSAASVILPVALSFMNVPLVIAGAVGSGVGAMINGASPGEALKSAVFGGVTGAAFSGLQSSLSGGNFMTGVAKGFTGVSPTVTPAGGPMAGANAPALQTGVQPSVFSSVNKFVQENPYITAGIAGLGGAALMAAAQPEEAPPVQMPTGPTQEQIQALRFPKGTFDTQSVSQNVVVPTIPFSSYGAYAPRYQKYYPVAYAATGGELDARMGGHLKGPGTGTSDSIPARLSDGEFVMTADAVRGAGNGSREKGARRMYELMHSFEKRA